MWAKRHRGQDPWAGNWGRGHTLNPRGEKIAFGHLVTFAVKQCAVSANEWN